MTVIAGTHRNRPEIPPTFPYAVYDDGRLLDCFRTMLMAQSAARMLNSGEGKLNPHGPVGHRVEFNTNRRTR